MKATTTQQFWNAGQIPLTKPSKVPTSWWTEPGTRQAFMDRAKLEHLTRMQFTSVTGTQPTTGDFTQWPRRSVDAD